jgi:uncharacterized protein (DUF2147 family)
MRLRLWTAGWLTVVCIGAAAAQRPDDAALGRWLTQDRDGVVEMFRCGDELCGRLVWLKTPRDARGLPPVDSHNPTPGLRSRPLCGLVILGGFRPSGPGAWSDGWVYDPQSGKTYHAELALEGGDRLKLRGYVGIPLFGASQTWTRADPGFGSCT